MKLLDIKFVYDDLSEIKVDGSYVFGLYCGQMRDEYVSSSFDTLVYHNRYMDHFAVGVLKEFKDIKSLDRKDLTAVELTFWDGDDISSIKKGYYYLPLERDAISVKTNQRGDISISTKDKPQMAIVFANFENTDFFDDIALERGLKNE